MHSEDSRTQPSSEVNSGDSRAEDHVESSLTDTSRPLYALFVLPVLVLSIELCVGYIRHFMLFCVRNIIRMVDNYMLLTDDEDIDHTPVKVLDTLDALSTFDYNSDNELTWNNSIERNAQDVVNKLEENKDDSSSSSIIDVNVEDYLKLFPKIPVQIHSSSRSSKNPNKEKHSQINSSTPLHVSNGSPSSKCSDKNRFVPTPDHFPSFNISISECTDKVLDEDDSQ